ncbi:MAG: ATP-binding protein [Desulfosalsimonas sp.]
MCSEIDEQKYRLIFEYAPLGILHFDSSGVITACNDNFLNIVGSSRKALVGLNMTRLPDRRVVDALEEALAGKTAFYEGEYQSVTADKTTPLRLIFGPVYSEDGKISGGIGIIEDITERKNMEAEHEKLEAQLRQAQKMEAVGRLAGGVAHDFNNTLSIINGYAEIALSSLDESHPIYNGLKEILRAGRRSSDLVRQLLGFARRQTISPVPMDLNHAVSQMLMMLQRLLGEDIELVWRPAADLWRVKIDPAQLDQILANLAVNARDAITGAGRLKIETRNVFLKEGDCPEDNGIVPGWYVMLEVSDNGCGMDVETADKLFEPFFTTKAEGEGTGLGLSTVYGIVKQNCGFIDVESLPGSGSIFRIYLPRVPDSCSGHTCEQGNTDNPKGTETVLLVEDDRALLDLAGVMLEQLGYNVISASCPGRALELAQINSQDITLLLTDVVMPEMNGVELRQRIGALNPDIKCLFMSGYAPALIPGFKEACSENNFIQKPFSRQTLSEKLRCVIDGC